MSAETNDAVATAEVVVEKVEKRGRPAKFVGFLETQIVKVLKVHGLTNGLTYLLETGVQQAPGEHVTPLEVSMPTLSKLAQKNKLGLKRGRPVDTVKQAAKAQEKADKAAAKQAAKDAKIAAKAAADAAKAQEKADKEAAKQAAAVVVEPAPAVESVAA